MKVTEFHKSKLTNDEKKLYEKLYSEVKNGNLKLTIKDATYDIVSKVYEALFLDHVELFYLSPEALIDEYEILNGKTSIGSEVEINFNEIYSDKLKIDIRKRFDLAVKRIKSILPENPTELDIEVAVIKYIHRICYSDIDNMYNQNAASVLAFGKAQCSGYAKAVALLLNKFKIECFVVTGEALGDDFNYYPHAWNIVKLKGDYYHLDVLYGHELRAVKYKMDLEYFNIPNDKIKRTHKFDALYYPKCTSEKFLNFKKVIRLDNKPFKSIQLD